MSKFEWYWKNRGNDDDSDDDGGIDDGALVYEVTGIW